MKVYFMKIQFKLYIIPQLIIKNLKIIIANILRNIEAIQEITILTYDALGLIYYAWKKNGKITSINDFSFNSKISGKIGTFSFKDKKVNQELNIYRTEKNKFIKY